MSENETIQEYTLGAALRAEVFADKCKLLAYIVLAPFVLVAVASVLLAVLPSGYDSEARITAIIIAFGSLVQGGLFYMVPMYFHHSLATKGAALRLQVIEVD